MTEHVKAFHELSLDELYRIMKLRVDIFVVEQNCPYAELDDRDQKAMHVWLEDGGEMLAYLRVMDRGVENESVSIGRVLSVRRRCGLGTRLLLKGIQVAQDVYGADAVYLEAQTYARGLYEKVGFRQVSEPFLLDGIPHIRMIRR